jgi:hypothetical protein
MKKVSGSVLHDGSASAEQLANIFFFRAGKRTLAPADQISSEQE